MTRNYLDIPEPRTRDEIKDDRAIALMAWAWPVACIAGLTLLATWSIEAALIVAVIFGVPWGIVILIFHAFMSLEL